MPAATRWPQWARMLAVMKAPYEWPPIAMREGSTTPRLTTAFTAASMLAAHHLRAVRSFADGGSFVPCWPLMPQLKPTRHNFVSTSVHKRSWRNGKRGITGKPQGCTFWGTSLPSCCLSSPTSSPATPVIIVVSSRSFQQCCGRHEVGGDETQHRKRKNIAPTICSLYGRTTRDKHNVGSTRTLHRQSAPCTDTRRRQNTRNGVVFILCHREKKCDWALWHDTLGRQLSVSCW